MNYFCWFVAMVILLTTMYGMVAEDNSAAVVVYFALVCGLLTVPRKERVIDRRNGI